MPHCLQCSSGLQAAPQWPRAAAHALHYFKGRKRDALIAVQRGPAGSLLSAEICCPGGRARVRSQRTGGALHCMSCSAAITVNLASPHYLYCDAPGHKHGMPTCDTELNILTLKTSCLCSRKSWTWRL